jgi:hypothetical protein
MSRTNHPTPKSVAERTTSRGLPAVVYRNLPSSLKSASRNRDLSRTQRLTPAPKCTEVLRECLSCLDSFEYVNDIMKTLALESTDQDLPILAPRFATPLSGARFSSPQNITISSHRTPVLDYSVIALICPLGADCKTSRFWRARGTGLCRCCKLCKGGCVQKRVLLWWM